MEELARLAKLVIDLNDANGRIAELIQRPAERGHLGEYIASKIFNIELNQSASHPGFDGIFQSGQLTGKSVDIKFYGKQDRTHNIGLQYLPDYYLIMTGEIAHAAGSRSKKNALVIKHVYLFEAKSLVTHLQAQGVTVGVATSIRKTEWDAAEIYPTQTNLDLLVTEDQRHFLKLFGT
jgi:hypothetical protein